MDTNLEKFFGNCKAVKDRIERDERLLDKVRRAFIHVRNLPGEGLRENECEEIRTNFTGYVRLEPRTIGLKHRMFQNFGKTEVAVTGDLYNSGIIVPSFVVILTDGFDGITYLTEDFGKLKTARGLALDRMIEECNESFRILEDKRYSLSEDSILDFGYTEDGKIVMYDLDCVNISNCFEINRGVITGQGEFARLKEIYEKLRSPELRLNL